MACAYSRRRVQTGFRRSPGGTASGRGARKRKPTRGCVSCGVTRTSVEPCSRHQRHYRSRCRHSDGRRARLNPPRKAGRTAGVGHLPDRVRGTLRTSRLEQKGNRHLFARDLNRRSVGSYARGVGSGRRAAPPDACRPISQSAHMPRRPAASSPATRPFTARIFPTFDLSPCERGPRGAVTPNQSEEDWDRD